MWLNLRFAVRLFYALRIQPILVLQSVRVVQRNLVYVVGLAMDICYEDVLRGSEFFGQFGKPIKVRLAAASLAHSATWKRASCHSAQCQTGCTMMSTYSRQGSSQAVSACIAGVGEPQHATQRQRRQERSQRQRVRHVSAAARCAAVHRDH